jgi:hypothetical protein
MTQTETDRNRHTNTHTHTYIDTHKHTYIDTHTDTLTLFLVFCSICFPREANLPPACLYARAAPPRLFFASYARACMLDDRWL